MEEEKSYEYFVESVINEVEVKRQTKKQINERENVHPREERKITRNLELRIADNEIDSEDLDYIPEKQKPITEINQKEKEYVEDIQRVFNINVSHDYSGELDDYPYELN